MEWLVFITLLAQGTIVFLLAMGFYGAARAARRREWEKDAKANYGPPREWKNS